MKIGCHGVIYGTDIATNTEEVLAQIAKTGFNGFEAGMRFITPENKDRFLGVMEKENLELSSLHAISCLAGFVDGKEKMFASVLPAVEFVKDMKNKNVSMSGLNFTLGDPGKTPDERLKDPGFVAEAAAAVDELARIAKSRGVALNYHNHAWEFENHALIFRTLIDKAPNLNFCLDLGWVYVGGENPVAVLKEHCDRVAHVHLRDYHVGLDSYVNLGEGDIDFGRIFRILQENEKKNGKEKWAVVEYEYGDKNYKRYFTAKLYLDYILNQINKEK